MLSLIFFVFAITCITVLPVMFAARIMGAERTGFGASAIAVILQYVLAAVFQVAMPESPIVLVIALLVGSAIYAYVLDTSVIKGFFISIISTVIALVAALLFGASFALHLASAT